MFVGEVKYTQNTGYAAQGLRELLEYVAYIKHDRGADSERGADASYGYADESGYVESKDDLFDFENVRRLLFVDDIGTVEDTDSAVTAIRPDGDPDHIL